MDHREIWHGDAVWPSWAFRPLKFHKFKNPRWRRPPHWKVEESPYVGRTLSDLYKIWHGDAVRPSWRVRPLKIWRFNNPRWRRPPSWKIKKWPYLSEGSTNCRTIWYNDAFWPSPWHSIGHKITNFWKWKMTDGCQLKCRKIAISG